MTSSSDSKKYYRLNYASLPDELCDKSVPVSEWLKLTDAVGSEGFPPKSLNRLSPLSSEVENERIVGISLYMAGNVLPFAFPSLLLCAVCLDQPVIWYILCGIGSYVSLLLIVEKFYYQPLFLKRYKRTNKDVSQGDVKDNQYLFTERNTGKYLSMSFVWPDSVHRPVLESKPIIFCAVPHGVAPFGITAYPLWSKVWNDKVCHWTTAPVVLKLPIVSFFMKSIGYIPAKSKEIMDVLTKKEENVGVVLDGIAGKSCARRNYY